MKLILLGGPGSGKGEAAKYLKATFPELRYVGMGDIVRNQIQRQTPCGQHCERYVRRGQLLPNFLANSLFALAVHGQEHWQLDGYPRSLGQLRYFIKQGYVPDILLHLDVSQRIMRQRTLKRGRSDDQRQVVEKRIKIYLDRTLLTLGRMKERFPKAYTKIDARGGIWDTNERILLALTERGYGRL